MRGQQFHLLGNGPDEIPAIGAGFVPEHFPRRFREPAQQVRRQRGRDPVDGLSRALGVAVGFVALGLQGCDPLLERWIAWIDDPLLDRKVETLKPLVGFGGALAQVGDVPMPAFNPLRPAVDDVVHHRGQSFGIEQTVLQVVDHRGVQQIHPHGHAFATDRTLTRVGAAGVVAIGAALAGPQRHRLAAEPAKADAAQQDRAVHEAWGHGPGIAQRHGALHGLERVALDQRRHGHHDMLGVVLGFLAGPVAAVEDVLADISRPRQGMVDGAYAPSAAAARGDALVVEIGGDRLQTHGAAVFDTVQRQAEDLAHGLGADGVDLELLLDPLTALFGRDDPIAERRVGAVPEALARVFLHRAQGVLGVLARLVLVEEVHHLAHHDPHRIVANLLGDRDDADPVFGQLAGVELEEELVTEEARERVDQDDVERRRLGGRRVDHLLERRAAVVGGRVARFDKLFGDGPALGLAVGSKLSALIGNGKVAFGLPAGRDPEIKRRARCGGRGRCLTLGHRFPCGSGQGSEQFGQHLLQIRLGDPQLRFGDRHHVGPIVGNRGKPDHPAFG